MTDVQLYATTPGGILALIRSGLARTRADLARVTGLAPSTITLRVQSLLDHGYIEEVEVRAARSGRRPRQLQAANGDRVIAGVELGSRHAMVALVDYGGQLVTHIEMPIDIAHPVATVLREVHQTAQHLAAEVDREVQGYGLAVPGPVAHPSGRVISPSRMPGWNGVNPAELLQQISGLEVLVENDANALAMGELAHLGPDAPSEMVVVKAGAGIGTGVLIGGQLYRGHSGFAGDISHTPISQNSMAVCACGRIGCLDVVAGGRAIIATLQAEGLAVQDSRDLLALARDAHPLTVRLLREAGFHTGEVLAGVVNFFNPQRLVIAGSLSVADTFVTGVRTGLYDRALPMAVENLQLATSLAAGLGGAHGAATLLLHRYFDPMSVNIAINGSHSSTIEL